MACKILFALLFFLPFVTLPFGTSHFETPKVVVAEIGIIILFIVYFLSKKKGKAVAEVWIGSILILLSFYHLIFSNTQVTLLGNSFRWQGAFLLWLLLGFSFLSQRLSLPKVSPVVFISCLILHVYFAVFGSLNNEGRSVGSIGEPNALAATVIFLWPWMLASKKAADKKVRQIIFVILALAVTILIIFLSGSRSGIVALGIQLAFLISYKLFKLRLLYAAFLASLLFLSSLALPFFNTETVYENRTEIWKSALISGYEHPIFGNGFGNTEIALKIMNKKLQNGIQGYYVDSSHNFLLDFWVQGGFVGLSCIVFLLYRSIRMSVEKNRWHVLLIFFGVVTVMLFNPASVVTLIQFWWTIGQSLKRIS